MPLPHDRNGPVRFGSSGVYTRPGSRGGLRSMPVHSAGCGGPGGAGTGSGRRGDGPGGMSARAGAASVASNTRASNPNHNARVIITS